MKNYKNSLYIGLLFILSTSTAYAVQTGGTGNDNDSITFSNVGIGTIIPRTALEISGDGAILATGTFGSGWIEPDIGEGTRMMWYPRKAAFRAGNVNTQWNNANIGDYSTGMGYRATASGIGSTAIGYILTASGDYSTVFGRSSYASGIGSTAIGHTVAATGDYSTALGQAITAGTNSNIVAIGLDNTSRTCNQANSMCILGGEVGIGTDAPTDTLEVNGDIYVSGGDIKTDRWLDHTSNVFIGENVAGAGNLQHSSGDEGYFNTAIGGSALRAISNGQYNTAIGTEALYSITAGDNNTAIGATALRANTGSHNTAIGTQALYDNIGGSENTAIGMNAANDNTSGSYNVILGVGALQYNETGSNNTVLGYRAARGSSLNNRSNNTVIGYQAGNILTTGSNNILLGYQAGDNLTSGASNIIIGYDINAVSATETNQLNIGDLIYGDLSNDRIGIGTNSPDYELQVNGTIAPEATGQNLGTTSLRWDANLTDVNINGTVTVDGSTGLSGTYNFDGSTAGTIATMTFTDGILTGATTN